MERSDISKMTRRSPSPCSHRKHQVDNDWINSSVGMPEISQWSEAIKWTPNQERAILKRTGNLTPFLLTLVLAHSGEIWCSRMNANQYWFTLGRKECYLTTMFGLSEAVWETNFCLAWFGAEMEMTWYFNRLVAVKAVMDAMAHENWISAHN